MLNADLARRILDLAPDAVVIADATGSIVFANRQVATLFGYEPDELMGAPVENLLPARFRARHIDHRRQFESRPNRRAMGTGLSLFARHKDGSEFPVEISLGPIAEGEHALVVAAVRDSTERQEMQAALREATAEAERANEAKSRFLATASHDLRQPVQTLSLLSGVLRRMTENHEALKLLDEAEHAIGAMSRLLNLLLDISKLESGTIRPNIAEFSVGALLDDLRADFTSVAAGKGLQLRVERCVETARSDGALVAQAMRNLVANAIKYTRHGSVTLRCRRDEATLRLEVEDTGIGIGAQDVEHICDDFYRVGVGSNDSREGYGLGLSIVSRIVALLGLRLDINSEPGKGSIFSLELPAAVAVSADFQAAGRPVKPAARDKAGRTHILLVEDDAGVRNATRMLLRMEGHTVSAADSLTEAVQLANLHPDIGLLISDLHLGAQQTGLQVVAAVRRSVSPDLQAILVTGGTSPAMRVLPIDSNLRVLSKPVMADELLGLIDELLEGR